MPDATLVRRDDVPVMFVRAADEQADITRAWTELEAAVGPLRGRKFYGTFDVSAHEYRACVQLKDGDDPVALGLEVGTLPGGSYARVRLQGEPPALYGEIAPAFDELAQRPDHDPSRLGIEHYRRRDEIDLLLPVAQS